MNDKIRVSMSIYIPGLGEYIDDYLIWSELNTFIKTLAPKINLQDLGDWNLLIIVLAQRTDAISVAKRLARYPSDKEYAIYMSIPIPDDEQAAYGLSCVKETIFREANDKYSHVLCKADFNSYTDLCQYIIESSKQAIDLAFTYGFTCKGKRIMKQK